MAWLKRFGWLIGPKDTEAKVVLVGLAYSGKSTIMQQLKPREVPMTELCPSIPIGLKAERFIYKTLTFVAFDLGECQNGFGNPWEEHYRHSDGIVFVVDSTDRMNVPLVVEQLDKLLTNPMVQSRKQLPLLVLANKADQMGAMPSLQLAQLLALPKLARPWQVVCTTGLTGEGLSEALDWLAHNMKPGSYGWK